MNSQIKLKYSTGQCDLGPRVEYNPGNRSLIVHYDYDDGECKTTWTRLVFRETICFRGYCDHEIFPEPFGQETQGFGLYVTEESKWLQETEETYERFWKLGRSERLHKPFQYKHFFVEFDHFGYFEVIAEDVEVIPDCTPKKK